MEYLSLADRVFTLMLVYRKHSMPMQWSFQMLKYLPATNSIDTVAGGFNFDLWKLSENDLFLNHFTEHIQIVNKPRHLGHWLIMPTKGKLWWKNFC